jgi:hypothetical protein
MDIIINSLDQVEERIVRDWHKGEELLYLDSIEEKIINHDHNIQHLWNMNREKTYKCVKRNEIQSKGIENLFNEIKISQT